MSPIDRRGLLAATAGVATLAAAPAKAQGRRPAIVLIHGAWHGGWCWAPVVERLVAAGLDVIAPDLPGHGTGAAFPAGYFDVPQDLAALAAAPSPLAALTLDSYRAHVAGILAGLLEQGRGPVVLVGHSLGGATLNAIGETAPQLVRRIVYLAALMPVVRPAAAAYFEAPAMASSLALPLLLGDPARTGAARLNPRSVDPAYRAAAKAAFYGDVTDAQFAAVANLLTPDEPIGVFGGNAAVTPARWGAVPRSYIRCTEDRAIPIAMQDQFIAEADAMTPRTPTTVRTLGASHSPFLSMPDALARLLAEAAA